MVGKHAQCVAIVKYNPYLTDIQVAAVAKDVDTSIRTVRRAIAEVRAANAVVTPGVTKSPKSSKKAKQTVTKRKPVTPPSFQPGASKKGIPPLPSTITFEHFCKYHMYPDYDGLYRWQIAADKKIGFHPFSLMKVTRDHGKSIYLTAKAEHRMSGSWDILYLGWTARRREVAQFVYTYFERRGEVIIDKSTSPFHFKTTLGTHFDTFSVKSKEVLGMHALGAQNRQIVKGENEYLEDFVRKSTNKLLLVIDDPIDGTFRKERHKETDLEDFYDSTIKPINPDQTMCVGTKKFQKDFLYYFEEKYKDDIVVIKNGPFLDKKDPRYGKEPDNPCNLLCPERWIWCDDPKYKKYLKLKQSIQAGILLSSLSAINQLQAQKRDLWEEKKTMKPYWWFAEYMQDPHPITGEVWETVVYRNTIKTQSTYNLLLINIDRATTQNKKSDETGIVVMLREYNPNADPNLEHPDPNQYLVINDLTQKITIAELIPLIHKLYMDYMAKYGRTLMIRVVVEKQGGGDDFCDLAYAAGLRWASEAIMIRVHSTRNKEDRTLDLLQMPILNGTVEFLSTLKQSKLVVQILSFPYSINDDAIDALGMGKLEGDKMGQKHNPKALREALEGKGKEDQLKQWNNIFGQSQAQSGRGIF